MIASHKLAEYVEPALPEARVASQWAGLVELESIQRRRRRVTAVAIAGSVVLAVALVIAPGWRGPQPVALEGTVVESGAAAAQDLTLPDGSHIRLGPSSRMSVAAARRDAVRLVLEKGSADLQVAPQDHRDLVVSAGGFDVTVVGTRFEVALGARPGEPRLRVSVREGKVKVRRAGGVGDVTLLGAGESWVDGPAAPPPAPSASTAPAAESAATPREAYAKLGTEGFARAVSAAGPKDLFELAELARLNGDPRGAAEALNKLRTRHRGDGRAALAAFELGRLRMDALGDPAGAAEALRDALALAPGGTFREDAEARLVQAYQATGDRGRCQAARDAYLAHHPRGGHAKVVSRLCEGR
jgi:hypothetical protein